MKAFRKLLCIFSLILFASATAFAQNRSVTGTLLDRETGEPLPYATVSVTPEGSNTVSKYVLSTSEGKVDLSGVKKGKYTLKIELMGYKSISQKVEMTDKGIDLGTMLVSPDRQMLNAASISDVGNPIIIKKDTIEYNASSFKTSDNDMLIDLLKKLPGIEVESDGSITANGETIKKITIDGKTFFLDDPQLASKNIPTKIIEKVKVIEKKSDQALFTGIDDGEEETIIDLNIKKGMMKGWFGNIMGGGGHDIPNPGVNDMNDWRWQGAGMIGHFTDDQQISVIMNANNTNNRGFNDMASSMMGSIRGGGGGRMGGGGGGWNGRESGVTTSWMGGINGAWTLLDGRMDLGGNYLYNGSSKYLNENSIKDNYLDNSKTLKYTEDGDSYTTTQGHRFGVRLDHKFSDNTSLLFEPKFNFGYGNYNDYSTFHSDLFGGELPDTTRTNQGFTQTSGYNQNWQANGTVLLRQKLGKPGRTISLDVKYDFSKNALDGINQSLTLATEDTSKVNQRIHSLSDKASLSGNLVYTEPLGNNFYLEANYAYSWNNTNSSKEVYDALNNEFYIDDKGYPHYVASEYSSKKSDIYSNDIINNYQNHQAGADVLYQKDKFRAQLGASYEHTITDNITNGQTYRSSVPNWAPKASINYEINDNSNLRFNYFGRSSQPSTSQLMPVVDNSDPLKRSLGNPYLKPYFTHSMRGSYRMTNRKSFTSVHVGFGGGLVQDPIINTTWYNNENGVQYSIPLNGPTSGNANCRIMVNSPLAKSKFSIFSMTNFRYNNSTSFIIKDGKYAEMQGFFDDPANPEKFNYLRFNEEVIEAGKFGDYFKSNVTNTLSFTERLRFTYRDDIIEVTLGGRTRMNKSWYTVSAEKENLTWNNTAEATLNWTIPGGVNLISEFNYNWYNGYTSEQPSSAILNAEITKLLFKNKVTLSLKGYDLLAQARNINVADTDNYHSETRNNTLGRYVILSLTYRFGNFGDIKGKMRGPGGPPPGDRGGNYGPPPGM